MKIAYVIFSLGVFLSQTSAGQSSEQHPLLRSGAVFLQEGFDGSGIPSGWNVHQILGPLASWTMVGTGTNPPVLPYAGTGQAKFNSYDAGSEEQSRLTTPAVNLSAATDPFVVFFLYHDEEFSASPDSVYLEVSVADSITGPWQTLAGFQRPRVSNVWKQEAISLFSYSGTVRLFVSLRGVSKFGNNIYVDEFRIADSSFHDIGITSLSGNGSFKIPYPIGMEDLPRSHKQTSNSTGIQPMLFGINQPATFNTIVQNFGTFAEPTYQINWLIDAEPQFPINNTEVLARNDRDTLPLTWNSPLAGTHSLTAWTSLNTDSNQDNDTIRLIFVVPDSNVVFSESFNEQTFPPSGWSVINRDGGALPPWFQGSSISAFLPYEGSGFAADNFQRSNGSYLDDYLITPGIFGVGQSGNADSIVFWARSAFNPPPSTNYPDSLMIRVSTSGVDTSDFSLLLDYDEVPKTGWTRFQYSLTGLVPPNSTVHIAFRYLHFAAGPGGANSDFIGVDAFQVKRSTVTNRKEDTPLPETFSLSQNYPNPFNPVTSIEYTIPKQQAIELRVCDIMGKVVATLANGIASPGRHYAQWNAQSYSSGTYFCRLLTGGGTQVRRMLLLK
jgi:hypothetical protein